MKLKMTFTKTIIFVILVGAIAVGGYYFVEKGLPEIMKEKDTNFIYSNVALPTILKIGDIFQTNFDITPDNKFTNYKPEVKMWIHKGNDAITLSENGEIQAKDSGLVVLGIQVPTYRVGKGDAFVNHRIFYHSFYIDEGTKMESIYAENHDASEFEHFDLNKISDEIENSMARKYHADTGGLHERTFRAYVNHRSFSSLKDLYDEPFMFNQSDEFIDQFEFHGSYEILGDSFDPDRIITVYKDHTIMMNYVKTDIEVNVKRVLDFRIHNGKSEIEIESFSHYVSYEDQTPGEPPITFYRKDPCYKSYAFVLDPKGKVEYAENLEREYCGNN